MLILSTGTKNMI